MQIYLDNAATTKMSRTAIEAMLPYMDSVYGNPSSLHSSGQKANEALVNARERIAELLGCEAREITFTSGGSKQIIRLSFPPPVSEKKPARSILFQPHLSITLYCIR